MIRYVLVVRGGVLVLVLVGVVLVLVCFSVVCVRVCVRVCGGGCVVDNHNTSSKHLTHCPPPPRSHHAGCRAGYQKGPWDGSQNREADQTGASSSDFAVVIVPSDHHVAIDGRAELEMRPLSLSLSLPAPPLLLPPPPSSC
jgi:hypothetical protein